MNLPLITLSTGLFDSFSTTFQILIFILLLATARPLATAGSFFAGVTLVYCLAGFGMYSTMDQLAVLLKPFSDILASVPDSHYYRSQLISSIVMIAVVPLYVALEKRSGEQSPLKRLSVLFARISPRGAFVFGMGFQMLNLAGSIPYFLYVQFIHSKDLGSGFATALLGYNLAYALPTLVVAVIYLIYRHRENIHERLHLHAHRTNQQITVWSIVGFSLVLIVDSALFFMRGTPLFHRFF